MDKRKTISGEIDFVIENNHFEKEFFHYENLYTETHYLALSKKHPLSETIKDFALDYNEISGRAGTPVSYPCASFEYLPGFAINRSQTGK